MSRVAATFLVALGGLALASFAPAAALGHGDEELVPEVEEGGAMTDEGAANGGEAAEGEAISAEEAEIEFLAKQPARVLAQQALATLRVNGDEHEAAIRLDAALESEDQSDIDVKLLMEATETLDGGDPEGAVPLLDQALSQPLGEESGAALHEAGREFDPGNGTQDVVAIVVGAIALLLGGLLLARDRIRARSV